MPEPTHTEHDMPFDNSPESITHQPIENSKTPHDRPFREDRAHQDVAPEPIEPHLTTSADFDRAFEEGTRGGN